MRLTYVARSLLDYRVPVLAELDRLCDGQLTYITSVRWTPARVLGRLRRTLGDRAIVLAGEKSVGTDMPMEANTTVCIPYQPGLARAITRSRPDILVGDGFFQWTAAALWQRLRRATPLVVCYERWEYTENRAQWYRLLYRKVALRFTDAISCNGRLSMEYALSLGYPPERITLGHMAADTEGLAQSVGRISPTDIRLLRAGWLKQSTQRKQINGESGTKSNGLVFLYVGRLIMRKGLMELLNGWALFQKSELTGQISDAILVIVGSGLDEHSILRQVRDLHIKNVLFMGTVDHDKIGSYYAAADVFVIPTLEDNWSLVVPEAMACGLPILCSKYNGCWPELVHDGQNGWVFDPLDPQDILRCLALCAEQQALGEERCALRKMGIESRRIVQDFAPGRAAKAIYRACQLACERRANLQSNR